MVGVHISTSEVLVGSDVMVGGVIVSADKKQYIIQITNIYVAFV
jgi:hypothetical protein